MSARIRALKDFCGAGGPIALVEVASTRGSTPRETGAFMLVSSAAICGTIGGGQLEFIAIAKARKMMKEGGARLDLDVPLGPEIGQCCGGRVEVSITALDHKEVPSLLARVEAEEMALPSVYVFGGGHVGKALASALALLPARISVIETRAEELMGMPDAVETRLTPVPEEMVRAAPPGTAFVVLTHDHALDFLIVAEALKRTDAAYVGMIGSRTKKATFRSWYLKNAGGTEARFGRLVSPIGGDAVNDKRPAVIAALAAAEIMTALSGFVSREPAPAQPHDQGYEKAESKSR